MRKGIAVVPVLAGLLCSWCAAQSTFDQIVQKAKTVRSTNAARSLSNDKIVAGLKEALTVSTRNAVASTGRPDGFLKNEAIKILVPGKRWKMWASCANITSS